MKSLRLLNKTKFLFSSSIPSSSTAVSSIRFYTSKNNCTFRPNTALFSSEIKMSKAGVTQENIKQDPKDTIFAKIVKGEIPCKKVLEDDYCLAFEDINPVAPVHTIIIPKTPIGGIGDAQDSHVEVLGQLMVRVPKVAQLKGVDESGYRIVINEGLNGQQSVRWLHIHLIGGKQLNWPPC